MRRRGETQSGKLLHIGLFIALGCTTAPAETSRDKKPEAKQGESTVALAQMEALSNALQFFYIDYNRFTTLENLDDILSTTASVDYQAINANGGALIFFPATGDLMRQTLTTPGIGAGPPYLNTSSSTPLEGPNGDYDEGTFLDPWGGPFYFYTPLGLLDPKTESISLRYYGDQFPDYRIVSHGPDLQPMTIDDVEYIVPFAPSISALRISSARVVTSTQRGTFFPYQLLVKGYNFGSSQGSGGVTLDGESIDTNDILSWTSTLITINLAIPPSASADVTVTTDGGQTSPAKTVILETSGSSAADWTLY